ncbi:MAG: rhomboid family intramembrane serine protease [Bryobacterales bacterium]|jgi:membrane associated rhomboid family serine protease|nr:rhomboid family intramembrane serine protease [Bryobacterales bacterium]
MAARRQSSSISFGPGPVPPAVKWLLISNTAIFVLSFLAINLRMGDIFAPFGLSPSMVWNYGAVWQFVTYLFLHSPVGIFHILFNMLTLWMFGTDLERDWGTRFFLKYYFVCGIGAGFLDFAIRSVYGPMDVRTIGASGAIYGLLLAYGMLYPNRTILFMFLFPLPARYFVAIIGAIAFFSSFQSGSGISHLAHLGGMLFGFGYLQLRRRRMSLVGYLTQEYQAYKLRRAKRKFQVYMRKRDRQDDRWVN